MAVKILNRKWFLILTILLTTTLLIILQKPKSKNHLSIYNNDEENYYIDKEKFLREGQWRMLSDVEQNNLSKLGRILYLGDKIPEVDKRKKYKILVWKYGPTIENRHLKKFSGKRINPFKNCPVSNCEITYMDSGIFNADIVIFHLHRMKGIKDIPQGERNLKQIWAFLTDESPYNTFLNKNNKLSDYNNIFNWSMTYRMDSDIPVPYGRTLLNNNERLNYDKILENKRRDVLVAIMGSNCGGKNHRWKYIKELQKYISIDIYGGCGPLKCPGHFQKDCPELARYIFYLAFENSNCNQYITEKLWWNAYEKNSIPIVMGASRDSYKQLAPPDSYINVENYASPRDLAEYILYLNRTNEFIEYYKWKRKYRVLNEHGYFGSESFHYCRICQALNYNSRVEKIYDNLTKFWSVERDCRPPWDEYY